MDRRYYIMADGGGTKIDALLFDDELRRLAYGSSGGVNTNFVSETLAAERFRESLQEGLEAHGWPAIERLTLTVPHGYDVLVAAARRLVPVHDAIHMSECETFLLSGLLRDTGLIALAGTGSGAHYRGPTGLNVAIGGYGGTIGDEALATASGAPRSSRPPGIRMGAGPKQS